MNVYVFLGPSLPVQEARRVLDASYLPPVAMGDLYALTARRARAGDLVGIVDGFFEQVPAVWHKEVLYALTRRVRVFGAASMGALRAAELHPFGMVGVGRVFEAYRSGSIEDDDEVAVAHAPAERGFKPISEAMVNVRFALEDAQEQGLIAARTRALLTDLAKSSFYAERSWGSILAAGAEAGAPPAELSALRGFLRGSRPDAKRADALSLLQRLAQECASPGEAPPAPDFVMEETSYWIGLTQARSGGLTAAESSGSDPARPAGAAVLSHARATLPEREPLWRNALLLTLLGDMRASFPVTREEVQSATERFCRRHGIPSASALEEWRRAQELSREELLYLLELETRRDLVGGKRAAELQYHALLALKADGRYRALRDEVLAVEANLRRLAVDKPTLADAGIGADELQDWYEERCGRMTEPADVHAREQGFSSLRDFVTELLGLYLLEHAVPAPAAGPGEGDGRPESARPVLPGARF